MRDFVDALRESARAFEKGWPNCKAETLLDWHAADEIVRLHRRIAELENEVTSWQKYGTRFTYLVDHCTSMYGDGYETPYEYHMQISWQQGAWIHDGSNGGRGKPDNFPGWSAWIDKCIAAQKEDDSENGEQ